MSFKIMIVDDDWYVRAKVRGLIQKLNLDTHIIGELANGENAMALAEQNPPDLMFLDVEMPKLNGIEVIRIAKQRHPQMHIVILSNYDTFAYVKSTLMLGALDYILKSDLCEETLGACLAKAGYQKGGRCEPSARQQKKSKGSIMFDRLMNMPGANDAQAASFMDECPIAKPLPVIMTFSNYEDIVAHMSMDALHATFETIEEILDAALLDEDKGLYRYVCDGKYYIVFDLDAIGNPAHHVESVRAVTSSLAGQIKNSANILISFVLSKSCGSPCDVPKCFAEAELYLQDNKHLCKERRLLDAQTNDGSEKKFFVLSALIESELSDAMKRQDTGRMESILAQCFHVMRESSMRYCYCQMLAGNMIILLDKYVRAHSPQRIEEFQEIRAYFQQIISECDLAIMQEHLTALFRRVCIKHPDSTTQKIDYALRYIEEHCEDELSLDEVAAYIQWTSSYFSTMVSRYTGKKFTDWVNEARTNRAKVLLTSTNLPIHEIAKRSGFRHTSYFITIFKKLYSISPQRYRQIALKTVRNEP